MASGLPVLYIDSGGVSELVGDCGLAVRMDGFRVVLTGLLSQRAELCVRVS